MGSGRTTKPAFSLSAYVRSNPCHTVEHCAVVMLICILLRDHVAKYADSLSPMAYGSYTQSPVHRAAPSPARHSAADNTTVQQLSTRDLVAMAQLHAASARLLEPSKYVFKGPAASVKQGIPGQLHAVSDARGSIYKLQMPDGVQGGLLHSSKGSIRGGHLHNCTEFVTVLSGTMRVVTKDLENGSEADIQYSEHETVIIPARVPHYFEALTNVNLVEWADGPKEDWYYLPYRSLVKGQAAGVPQRLAQRRYH